MGRVSKYKKSKKVDLFNEKANLDDKFDRPPEEHERQVERVSRKRRRQWAKEALDEDAYIEALDAKSGVKPSSVKAVDINIEPKREEESMKSFQKRIREQTRQILMQESKNRSSTAQKRKTFLKEKKQKQKQSKKNYEEVLEIGGTSEFPTVSAVKFGEVADRPPEFQLVPKPKKPATGAKHTNLRLLGHSAETGPSMSQQRQMEALRQSVQEAYAQVKKRRRAADNENLVL